MELIQDKTMVDERVRLDNKNFVKCTLTNCTLEYGGAPVSFYGTRFSGCKYLFFDGAQRTVLFLQEMDLLPQEPGKWYDAGGEGNPLQDGDGQRKDGPSLSRPGDGFH